MTLEWQIIFLNRTLKSLPLKEESYELDYIKIIKTGNLPSSKYMIKIVKKINVQNESRYVLMHKAHKWLIFRIYKELFTNHQKRQIAQEKRSERVRKKNWNRHFIKRGYPNTHKHM